MSIERAQTDIGCQYQTLHSANIDPQDATPMIAQFLQVKQQYPGVILFYRMGDFYETFFEDALISARVLEITLTGRDAGKLGRVPMAGVPVKAVEPYLGKLLAQNFKVAICEQVEDTEKTGTAKGASASKLMSRKVVRVLSSGTLTEQSLLKSAENNFLCAVSLTKDRNARKDHYGLAYCDITTGEFYATELDFGQLLSELDRIRPAEILAPGKLKRQLPTELIQSGALPAGSISQARYLSGVFETLIPQVPVELSENYTCTALSELAFDLSASENALKALFNVATLEGFNLSKTETPLAIAAAGAITHYIKGQFIEQMPVFDGLRHYVLSQSVTMNTTARRNLELVATVKNNHYEGSLLWVLDQTQTSMGGRLLRQWINQPLTYLPEIQSRLDAVEELVNQPAIRDSLTNILPEIYDMERLSIKVANTTALPRDLIALKQSIAQLPAIANLLKPCQSFYLSRLQAFPPELFTALALIDQAIDDSPPLNLKGGGMIKTGFHQELDKLRNLVENHEQWLRQYEENERVETGIRTLKVSFNSAFGYFIEVTRANAGAVPAHYHRKQTLTNAERYTTETLKQHEAQVLDAQSRQYDLEYQLFIELRQQLLAYAPLLKDCAQRVAALDVLQSLARVAIEQQYTKPILDESLELNLQNCRHPVVEKILPMGRFVPNHCHLSATPDHYETPQMMLITGPNMAGKSTYMRQVALCVLMAQMGSFVPASYARIGIVDGIYTRVGAVDDLSSGQSTFMVEMSETSQILNGASRRSLVLLDEVGRGTSTYDGVAIAWSVSEYLTNHLGCRTLFATHYHELNTLETLHSGIRNYRVCVSESGSEIEFLHTVEPGAAQKSYGIQVAKMAGLPKSVIQKADSILSSFQKREMAVIAKAKTGQTPSGDNGPNALGVEDLASPKTTPQLTLFSRY
ncbi:MAG: DNA mismatch repair protein MutS [Vampirovibrionales bacterium]|nr:DNA mismatch repair protein MutS [Vampirovibrionales bacterium]